MTKGAFDQQKALLQAALLGMMLPDMEFRQGDYVRLPKKKAKKKKNRYRATKRRREEAEKQNNVSKQETI